MKRIPFCLLLIIVALLCCSTVTSATEVSVTPRYSYINNCVIGFTIDSSGKASCSCSVEPTSNLPVQIMCKLQKKVDGEWTTVKYWTKTDNGATVVGGNYYVYSGYEYRVFVTAKVFNADKTLILETITKYSNYISY